MARQERGVPEDGVIEGRKFRGQPEWFAILDRNHNGAIEATDLGGRATIRGCSKQPSSTASSRCSTKKGDGKVTLDDMKAFVEQISLGGSSFTARDLRDAVLSDGPPPGPPPGANAGPRREGAAAFRREMLRRPRC